MTRPSSQRLPFSLFAILPAVAVYSLLCQSGFTQELSSDHEARDERLAEMKQRLKGVTAKLTDANGKSVILKVGQQPLLRFNDPARTFHDGGIWALNGESGPAILIALEHYESGWAWELISLAEEDLSVELPDGWKWSPETTGSPRQRFPDAPEPAASARQRLVQMKSLVRQFSAHESGDEQQYSLRLLPRPLARYSDPKRGLNDGALFVFAYGTNPEIVALLESRSTGTGKEAWYYSFAPLTTAAAGVHLGEKELWSKEHNSLPKTQEPYTYFGEPD